MREALGWDVTAPLMSELGWRIESQTEVLLRHLDSEEFDLVAGSSMGGLAAANAAAIAAAAAARGPQGGGSSNLWGGPGGRPGRDGRAS